LGKLSTNALPGASVADGERYLLSGVASQFH
jgi:hypothetical protein